MSDTEIISRLAHLLGEGKTAILCTLIDKTGSGPRDVGAKMLVDPDGNTIGTIGGGGMERRLVAEALEAMGKGRPRTLTFAMGIESKNESIAVDSKCGGEVKIFMDVIKPALKLIIVGSGHIAKPVAELADKVGFEVIVVDDADTATWARFPMAKEIHSGHFHEEINLVEVRPSDYVAIVHGETEHELTALRVLLKQRPAYIGLLGSRNKAAEHKRQLLAEGLSREDVESIRAPIGLQIGAETPEEIAVSILAEIIGEMHLGRPRTAA